MMKTIVEEKPISFKELEQKIFSYVCELGREITTAMLEAYDKELAEGRDKKNYRDKGIRTTTIKTVYGEVSYGRHVYQTKLEDGKKACVYLLDEAMKMEKIGLISTNLAEKLAMTVTEAPYRVTAETISSTCGQSISAGGVWNVMQRLGERISEEEEHAVKQMHADQSEGKKEIPVLFEEMDGVWLSMQDEQHKKMKKQEMKVFTMYEGWDAEKEKQGRSSLVGKTMLAGMEKSKKFHEKREACVLLTQKRNEKDYEFEIEVSLMIDSDRLFEDSRPTYTNIRKYVFDKYGIKLQLKDIADVKRDYGMKMKVNKHLIKGDEPVRRKCTPNKRKYIIEALKYYHAI